MDKGRAKIVQSDSSEVMSELMFDLNEVAYRMIDHILTELKIPCFASSKHQ